METILPIRVGNKIRKVREIKGFTQEYVASQLNLSQTYYSKIERDDIKEMTVDRLERIAKILEVVPGDILNFDEQQVFISTFANHSGSRESNMTWINNLLEREREQYEARIKQLEKEVNFLQEMLRNKQ